jgi:N6-L-threonylcarbamoyladenine synthase/protein kinase Bud32
VGVRTPVLSDVTETTLQMEQIYGPVLKEALCESHLFEAGKVVGTLHCAGIVHGDLTTCNMIAEQKSTGTANETEVSSSIALIDFGLAHMTTELESRGVDLHVLFQILTSTSAEHENLKKAFCLGYSTTAPDAALVISREKEICERGRYL